MRLSPSDFQWNKEVFTFISVPSDVQKDPAVELHEPANIGGMTPPSVRMASLDASFRTSSYLLIIGTTYVKCTLRWRRLLAASRLSLDKRMRRCNGWLRAFVPSVVRGTPSKNSNNAMNGAGTADCWSCSEEAIGISSRKSSLQASQVLSAQGQPKFIASLCAWAADIALDAIITEYLNKEGDLHAPLKRRTDREYHGASRGSWENWSVVRARKNIK